MAFTEESSKTYNDDMSIINNSDRPKGSYERISPTAWLLAYERSLSDVPFSQEIFSELQEIVKQSGVPSGTGELGKTKYPELSLIWEARYKIVNRLLKETHIDQVLEIASGFSPRGIDMAKDPSLKYVEIDLPNVIQEKREIMARLVAKSKVAMRPNLRLEEGNALDIQDLLKAGSFFQARPVAVVTEGLLNYFEFDERGAISRNIHRLLDRFGGVWITPDIPIRPAAVLSERIKERMARVERITGIDVLKNRFENEAAARTFFENLGFTVEQHNFIEVADELTLSVRWKLSPEQVEKIIGKLIAFVMKANSAD